MNSSLSVPHWLALGVGVLTAWTMHDRLLKPSARWFVRSRTKRVPAEARAHLKISVRPFQPFRHQALIDRLIFDDKVLQAAQACADARGMPRQVALDHVQHHAREIVPAFNADGHFRVGYWIGRTLSGTLYRVRIGYTDDAGLNAIPEDATVVFGMNHRSNMAYIIASHLIAEAEGLDLPRPGEEPWLRYYANSIAHLLQVEAPPR